MKKKEVVIKLVIESNLSSHEIAGMLQHLIEYSVKGIKKIDVNTSVKQKTQLPNS